jgi:serine/threonine protein phosphatase PrpC
LRSCNEDNCVAQRTGRNACFLAVADGMRGKIDGDLARKIALSTMRDLLNSDFFENIFKILVPVIFYKYRIILFL